MRAAFPVRRWHRIRNTQIEPQKFCVPKFARLVVPGYPHHVTQRGVRKQRTFFDDADYRSYLNLVAKRKTETGVGIWAYCLMPNHVHVVAVPRENQGLAKLFGVAHHRYSKRVNAKYGWSGHLWQERFYSVVMDESHALAAIRYVELNPVRAGLCHKPELWPWSSVHAHLGVKTDELVDKCSLAAGVGDWSLFLGSEEDRDLVESLRASTGTGRPAGDSRFITLLESKTGRRIRRRRPGRPCKK